MHTTQNIVVDRDFENQQLRRRVEQLEQCQAESRVVREMLGLDPDAIDISPIDLQKAFHAYINEMRGMLVGYSQLLRKSANTHDNHNPEIAARYREEAAKAERLYQRQPSIR